MGRHRQGGNTGSNRHSTDRVRHLWRALTAVLISAGLAVLGAGIATAGNANASPAASGNITAVGVCVGTQPQNNYGQLRLSGSVSALSQSTAYSVDVDGNGATGATTGTRNSDSQGTLDVAGMIVEVVQNAYVAGSSYTWGVYANGAVTPAATGTLTVQNGNCAPVQPSGSASAVGVYSSLSNGKYQQVQLNLNYKGLKPSTDYGVSIEDSGYNGSVEYTGTTDAQGNLVINGTNTNTRFGVPAGNDLLFIVEKGQGAPTVSTTIDVKAGQPPTTTPVNKVSASCDGIVLDLSGYGASQTENVADIYVDNGLVAEVQFADSYHNTTDVGPYVDTSKHTWKVVVKSSLLPNGEQDYSGTFGPCKTETTSPPGAIVRLAKSSVVQGANDTATGSGFAADEKVAAVLHSAPVQLGTFTADKNGKVSFSFTVPAGLATGTHTVILTGQSSGRTASAKLTVTASAATSTASAPGTGSASLANTGTRTAGLLGLGAGLLLLGTGAMLLSRRRPVR